MSDETKPDTPEPVKPEEPNSAPDAGTFRRPLIRASLPHADGSPASQREAPVFTMHEQPARGNNWGKGGRSGSNGNGNVQAKKHGRRRSGGHGRSANDQQASGGNHSGNQANGNQLRPEGRSGSKNRPSRRNRGRSR